MSTAHNEDYRILIRSVSEQFEHTEPLPAEETDKIELMTYGSFLKKAGSYYISYKETETIGFAGCTTTIKIAEDGSRVALLRFGKVQHPAGHPAGLPEHLLLRDRGRPHYAGRDRRRHRVRSLGACGRHGKVQLSAGCR